MSQKLAHILSTAVTEENMYILLTKSVSYLLKFTVKKGHTAHSSEVNDKYGKRQ